MAKRRDPTGSRERPDYEVGYGRPPREHQFKKGQSGNPGGRPHRMMMPLSPTDIIERELSRPVRVREGEEVAEVSAFQACVRSLLRAAANGDVRAQGLVLNATSNVKQVGLRPATEDEMIASMTPEERGLIDQIQQELSKYDEAPGAEDPGDEDLNDIGGE